MGVEIISKHKFMEGSNMTFEEVFNMAYQQSLIWVLQGLAKELGEDRFGEALKKVCL